jgi:hypothetical protein
VIDFPDAPAVGDLIVAANGLTWRWNGAAWDLVSSGEEGGGGGTASPVTVLVAPRLPALVTCPANSYMDPFVHTFPAPGPGQQAIINVSCKLMGGTTAGAGYFVVQHRCTGTDIVLVEDFINAGRSGHMSCGMLWIPPGVTAPLAYKCNLNNNPSNTETSFLDDSIVTCTYFPA